MARVRRIGELNWGFIHVDVFSRAVLAASPSPIEVLTRLGCNRALVHKVLMESQAGLSVPVAHDFEKQETTLTFFLKFDENMGEQCWDAVVSENGAFYGYSYSPAPRTNGALHIVADSTNPCSFGLPPHMERMFQEQAHHHEADLYCFYRQQHVKIVAACRRLVEIRSSDGYLDWLAGQMSNWAFSL